MFHKHACPLKFESFKSREGTQEASKVTDGSNEIDQFNEGRFGLKNTARTGLRNVRFAQNQCLELCARQKTELRDGGCIERLLSELHIEELELLEAWECAHQLAKRQNRRKHNVNEAEGGDRGEASQVAKHSSGIEITRPPHHEEDTHNYGHPGCSGSIHAFLVCTAHAHVCKTPRSSGEFSTARDPLPAARKRQEGHISRETLLDKASNIIRVIDRTYSGDNPEENCVLHPGTRSARPSGPTRKGCVRETGAPLNEVRATSDLTTFGQSFKVEKDLRASRLCRMGKPYCPDWKIGQQSKRQRGPTDATITGKVVNLTGFSTMRGKHCLVDVEIDECAAIMF
ncbi:predicted protein [Postia placenta Mad-698-R]|nr:predicted protein [Postia placenta Mad-698-R]